MAASHMLVLIYKTLGILTGLLASVGLLSAIDFKGTITLGSVLLSLLVIALAAFFTIRSKIATIWREEAEGERAAKSRLEEIITTERGERAKFERAQQDLRHDLKGELATCKAQLKAMEARTDLTAALEAIRVMNADLAETISRSILEFMKLGSQLSEDRDRRTHHLLAEIRDKLPTEPFIVTEEREK